MTVRRLADESVQPGSFAFNEANAAAARNWIAKYPKGREQSAVIPLMMLAQEQDGWVTRRAIEAIADMLGMAYIRVLEVATFYTQFQLKPVGTRAHVQVCGTTPCMLRGAGDLIELCRDRIHPEQHHTIADGTLSWEEVECLGACVNAPMVMIFKDTFEDLTAERLAEIIDQFAAGHGASVPVGPQNGRVSSTPLAGLTSLTSEHAVLKSTREEEEARAASEAEAALDAPVSEAQPLPAADAATVPPSKAGKPRTHAAETNGSLKTPSPQKTSAAGERATSAPATAHDPVAANETAPAVEGAARQRKAAPRRPEEPGALRSPELLRGEPIGASARKQATAKPALDDPSRPKLL
jgi:NADH-quinone oxidoreductase subunit E